MSRQMLVTLNIFSGRVDPVIPLTQEEQRELREKLKWPLPKIRHKDSPWSVVGGRAPVLGYRGFEILFSERNGRVFVWNGTILFQRKHRYYRQDAKEVEPFLLDVAKRHGHEDLLREAGAIE